MTFVLVLHKQTAISTFRSKEGNAKKKNPLNNPSHLAQEHNCLKRAKFEGVALMWKSHTE